MNYHNFAAGPACLPEQVLHQIREEVFTPDQGVTLLEYPHRTPKIQALAEDVLSSLREALGVPSEFEVLLLSGGARLLYGAIPLNFLSKGRAVYGISGHWSKMAYEEAKRMGQIEVAFENDANRRSLPDFDQWYLPADSQYCHLVDNETIDGLCLPATLPDRGVPYIIDMTSSLGMLPLDYNQYGLIYAGAQKALGISGLTIAIIRKDWLTQSRDHFCPAPLNFRAVAEQKSMMITPPVFAWVACKWMSRWLTNQGGIAYFYARNRQWADRLYTIIDEKDCYHNAVDPRYRSQINIIFTLKTPELTGLFCEEAKKMGLLNLKGHQHKGGIRISLYPAMQVSGFELLCEFMQTFST